MPIDGKSVLAAQWTLIAIATAVIGARLNLRLRVQKRRLLASDVWTCIAWVCGTAGASITTKFVEIKLLEPEIRSTLSNYEGTPAETSLALQLMAAVHFLFLTTFYLCKAALLAVYMQIFPVFMVKRRIFLRATIGYVIVSFMGTMLIFVCSCLPLSRNWAPNKEDRCPPTRIVMVFEAAWALHFTGDILIFILPWLIVADMNLKGLIKYGVYFTFMLGIVNLAVCLVRFLQIQFSGGSESMGLATVVFWTSLDVFVGLVIACLPSLRPYFGGSACPEDPSLNTVKTNMPPMGQSISEEHLNAQNPRNGEGTMVDEKPNSPGFQRNAFLATSFSEQWDSNQILDKGVLRVVRMDLKRSKADLKEDAKPKEVQGRRLV